MTKEVSVTSSNWKTRLSKVTAIGVFVIVILWILTPEEIQQQQKHSESALLHVSTIKVQPTNHRPDVKVVGTTKPRWQLSVISAVEGRIDELDTSLEPGSKIKKQQQLLKLEDSAYQAQLASTAAEIKKAEQEVARILHEQTVVQNINPGKTLSAYGRFEPHLQSARATLDAAQANWLNAKKRLTETRITSPFDGIVLTRKAVPGQWVNAGEELFTLAASDSIDVHLELSAPQLTKLGKLNQQTRYLVTDNSGKTWPARLRYQDPNASANTRQKQLVLYVEQPYISTADHEFSLSPNAMVNVTISGQSFAHVVSAPSSVLTPDGQVWIIDAQNKLQKQNIDIKEEFDHKVFFQFSERPNQARQLVLYPLSIMLPEQQVVPEIVADLDNQTSGGHNL